MNGATVMHPEQRIPKVQMLGRTDPGVGILVKCRGIHPGGRGACDAPLGRVVTETNLSHRCERCGEFYRITTT